jgi:hypothetical protein
MAVFGRIASLILGILPRPGARLFRLSGKSILLPEDRILVRECARDEVVLFDSENRNVYLLNHTAAAVIRLTDGARNLECIARKVAWDFDVKAGTAARDIRKIYRELLRKGVITMAPDRSFILKLKRETVVREEDDGAFIFDPITDGLSAVNETGLLVLRQIDGKKTLADIINAVSADFSDVDPEQVGRDVETFVDGLVSRKLIEA